MRSSALLGVAWLEAPLQERARTLAVTDHVPRHLREVRERRLPELDKIESAVKERMRREITHLQHRDLELEVEERAGRRPRLNSENMLRQCAAMTDRLALRLTDIAPLPPEVCAAALVVPASLLRAEEAERAPDNMAADRVGTATRAEVEAKAMRVVMDRERTLGFEPVDVSPEDRGYDIESRDPAPIFGPEPGFNEVSRAISAGAIKRAASRG